MNRVLEPARPETAGYEEEILEPELPIVDAHHHLWFQTEARLASFDAADSLIARVLAPVYRRYARYLFEGFHADAHAGHDVRASVFVDARLMYRADGPEALRPVGEVEFVNGLAAMWASGAFGEARLCAGIVGGADLTLGDRAAAVLDAQLAAGGERCKGVRSHVSHDADPQVSPPGLGHAGLMLSDAFRAGFRHLAPRGLSFDAFVFAPQLSELAQLARAFPDTSIVLEHVGGPLGIGRYAGRAAEQFAAWRAELPPLVELPNVTVKLSGLGMPFSGIDYAGVESRPRSAALAELWRPYVESCIELFGVDRCMFASNYPVESLAASYPVLWNAFKRIAAGASADEKAALFGGSARRIYRLGEAGLGDGGLAR
jgi:predicted TIM-barrel fold metal-dependent hydrolase